MLHCTLRSRHCERQVDDAHKSVHVTVCCYGNGLSHNLERTAEDKLVWSRPNETKPRNVHTRPNTALTREQRRAACMSVCYY